MDGIGARSESVVHPFAITPCLNEAGTTQVGEVTRDFRLRHVQNVLKLADAMLTLR